MKWSVLWSRTKWSVLHNENKACSPTKQGCGKNGEFYAMRTDITKINEKTPHDQLTEGLMVFAGGTSKLFQTGDWRTNTPVVDEEKCKQCLLCTPVCPDGCIPVKDGKRQAFDMMHCKGCGICANVCPFGAIEMKEGNI